MDANRYATKKTIAQGMLDIALLTANASQLKYILQVGQKHEFYTLMLILISVSIIMQVNKFIFFFIQKLFEACSMWCHLNFFSIYRFNGREHFVQLIFLFQLFSVSVTRNTISIESI